MTNKFDWDWPNDLNDESGLHTVHRWVKQVKGECEKNGFIFDSLLKCESEGGDLFTIDPETIEAVVDVLNEHDLWPSVWKKLGRGEV